MDKANACIHLAETRFSPITFRLAEMLNDEAACEHVLKVLDDKGRYPEDVGR